MEHRRTVSMNPAGTNISRLIKAMTLAGDDRSKAIRIAEEWRDCPEVAMVLKAEQLAGTTTGTTWASALVTYGLATELLRAIEPFSVVSRLTPLFRRIPFGARVARELSQSTAAAWVAEYGAMPMSAMTLDTIAADNTKLAVLACITRELSRASGPDAEREIRVSVAS